MLHIRLDIDDFFSRIFTTCTALSTREQYTRDDKVTLVTRYVTIVYVIFIHKHIYNVLIHNVYVFKYALCHSRQCFFVANTREIFTNEFARIFRQEDENSSIYIEPKNARYCKNILRKCRKFSFSVFMKNNLLNVLPNSQYTLLIISTSFSCLVFTFS